MDSFQGGYPARLKKVLIVTAPLWFKAPFKILRLFVREKLRERVFTVSVPTLSLHVPREALPRHLGGTLEIDHSTWLLHCYKSMTNREDELLANIGHQPTSNGLQIITTTTGSSDFVVVSSSAAGGGGGDTTGVGGVGGAVVVVETNDNNPDTTAPLSEFWSENPPSSASSGFSDDDSLAGAEGDPKTIEHIVQMVKERGRHGLFKEYADIRSRAPEGTFIHAK